MKRTLCFLLLAAVLLVVSCGSKDEPVLTSINPGLYEISHDIKYGGQLIVLKQRSRYNADGTYSATNFQNNVAVEELRGKYKVENNKMISYETERRLITQDGEWEKKDSFSDVDVRNMKKDSYEYYFKYPDELSKERYKSLGLAEGWKKYRRISD